MTGSTSYVALLRGINVGGHRKVPMATLRSVLEQLGFADVRTYLQSGNAVFTTVGRPVGPLAREIEAAILAEFGFDVDVVVLTKAEFTVVAESHPYAAEEPDPARLFASFLLALPTKAVASAFDVSAYAPERAMVVGQVIYLHYPEGFGQAKLTASVLERQLGKIKGTARNWRTVQALVEIL